ncbi:hypothetical protein [Rheinheimera texasensis]|uniref:hypothetical protein n=1 Tax=Rheinheimera texasensis TaxID=306205 RepID=UPI0004E0BB83|nr:hypothetical protein [Rheinheimera texasensis]
MHSLRLSVLHCALCSAVAPLLFVSGSAVAGETPQQVEPVSSELFCDWLHKKPARSKETTATTDERRIRVGQIHIRTEPIFVEDADAIWLHHFANWAHVTTRPDTVGRELPFAIGEEISVSDLAEAERLLRDKSYLHDAKVRLSPTCNADQSYDVVVETSDNWSLLPSFGLGRSGGQNKYAFGFKEDNFLGFGVRTSVKYQSDAQRSGYEFKLEMPLSLVTGSAGSDWFAHSYLTAEWTNNDDGHVQQLQLEKPFYQDDSRWMYRTEWLSDLQQTQVFHNGALENIFETDHRRVDLSAGMLWSYQDRASTRLLAGVLSEDWRFAPALLQPTLALPQDRSWAYPWVGVEYKQHDYRVLQDILFIDRAEDINLGWHHSLKAGVQSNKLQADTSLGYRLIGHSSKGFGDRQHLVLLEGGFDFIDGLQGGDLREWRFQAEDFYQLNRDFTWYNKAELTRRNRNFADLPLELGGDSGLRGYPLQYQHGISKTVLTSELRWYPRINLYKMLDLGFVAFADLGRVNGGSVADPAQLNPTAIAARFALPLGIDMITPMSPPPPMDAIYRSNSDLLRQNLTDRWLGSVGVGMRIYSSKSSNNHVVHIDLSTPMTSAPGVDSWEIELNVSNRF